MNRSERVLPARSLPEQKVSWAVFVVVEHEDANLVAETGSVTVVQFGPINHDDILDPDESATPESIAVSYTVTAPDADDATATITVNLEDDGPDASALVLRFE